MTPASLATIPRWMLFALLVYVAFLVSYAVFDNRRVDFWPPSIHPKQTPETGSSREYPSIRAPHLGFRAIQGNLAPEVCVTKGLQALEKQNFTGRESKPGVVWGFMDEFIGAVWCDFEHGLVVFLAAGPKDTEAWDMAEAIRRSF